MLILGEKTDVNLYQAVCRGDRKNRKDETKTHFNVYVPDYLNCYSNTFLFKLIDGFENELDFGNGEEKASGQTNNNADAAEKHPELVPMALHDKKMVVELVNAYNREHHAENAVKQLYADAKQLLDNGGTRGEAIAIAVHRMNDLHLAVARLMDFVNFCNEYETSDKSKKKLAVATKK